MPWAASLSPPMPYYIYSQAPAFTNNCAPWFDLLTLDVAGAKTPIDLSRSECHIGMQTFNVQSSNPCKEKEKAGSK